ncbi:MAG TPA: penicillin-binding transpeptidase domain-containing protein [Thermodesulfobacteriota bacterium]|nr:penicillin-binding transpeptidase domain-containing protein [Thermodesulfobacteriota bacterium]
MKQKSMNWFKVRIVFLSCLLFVCFVFVMGRMFQLQVLKKEQLYKLAAQQQHVQIPLVPKRGTVYDSNGDELAVSIEVESVYVDARKVVDVEKTARELASILQIDREELKQRLKTHRPFEWVQRKISSKEAERIKALQLPGVSFLNENRRFYPNSQLAAHLIGFVGLDSKGLEGIEFQYDALLNGENRVWTAARDALGRQIAMGNVPFEKEDHYRNIVLTVDKAVQHIAETELDRGVERWGAKGGMVIAMDPSTGKILAMASYPTFNPNQFIQYRSKSWRNEAISDVFEPGSLFKVFLAAAALEEQVVRPSDSFFCENGSYTVYDRTIHDTSKHGWLTFQQILKFSSNIGASKVGEKMGRERFYRYIAAFGFGEKTQINLPGEGKGIVHHPRYWPPVALDTISFGQGISVTGIQLVTALSAIANGGFLMRPYVVEKTLNEKGEVVQSFQPETIRKVISGATAEKVTALLKTTTEKGGTGEGAVPAGYDVAGKTGTAQKVDSLLGGYSETRYTSSFMGFAPSGEPKLALLVVIDEPQGGNYGGVVAAPIFKAIMEKVLPYLHVVPRGTMIVKNELNAAPRKEMSEAQPLIDEIKVGKGAETVVMPDLKGLSMRNALSRIEGRGLIIKVSGNGKVVEQTPRPGTVIEKGDICFLKFRSSS